MNFKINIIDSGSPSSPVPQAKAKLWDSHLTAEYLDDYGTGNTFIETGTYLGDTVKMILDYGKFAPIYSSELDPKLFEDANKLFENNPSVYIMEGDSVDVLDILAKSGVFNQPCTFWLDAHASGPQPGGRFGGSPVIKELEAIKQGGCKTHTIFIDDRRLFGSSEWSYVSEIDARKVILEINPDYKFVLLDGYIKEDILCAYVDKIYD